FCRLASRRTEILSTAAATRLSIASGGAAAPNIVACRRPLANGVNSGSATLVNCCRPTVAVRGASRAKAGGATLRTMYSPPAPVGRRETAAACRREGEPPWLRIERAPPGAAEGINTLLTLEGKSDHVVGGHVAHLVRRRRQQRHRKAGALATQRGAMRQDNDASVGFQHDAPP